MIDRSSIPKTFSKSSMMDGSSRVEAFSNALVTGPSSKIGIYMF